MPGKRSRRKDARRDPLCRRRDRGQVVFRAPAPRVATVRRRYGIAVFAKAPTSQLLAAARGDAVDRRVWSRQSHRRDVGADPKDVDFQSDTVLLTMTAHTAPLLIPSAHVGEATRMSVKPAEVSADFAASSEHAGNVGSRIETVNGYCCILGSCVGSVYMRGQR